MPFSYKISPNSYDLHVPSDYWFAVVIPFKYRTTYNRSKVNPGSSPQSISNPVTENPKIFIDNDCVQWQTSSSKGGRVSGLSMVLKETNKNYDYLIIPEDWIIFWAFNDYQTYVKTKELVKNNQRANHFQNAPKFVGRVKSLMKNETVEPGSGRKDISYTLTANGFTELDSKVYYNSSIGINYPKVQQQLADFGNDVNQLITVGGFITTDKAITEILGICLGLGPGKRFKGNFSIGQGGIESTIQTSPNDTYLIPDTVAKLLLPENSRPISGTQHFTYKDLIELTIGVQKYGNVSIPGDINNWSGFIPSQLSQMSGKFLPQPLHFNNTPVWNLLETYLNRPIDEMYACMRVNKDGYVMPSLIVRQMPFSSNKFVKETNNGTPFTSLPRWEIDKALILNKNIGRSSSVRFNYLQLIGVNPIGQGNQISAQANAYLNHQPISDPADLQRSGLETLIQNTNCQYIAEVMGLFDNNRYWNFLMADALFGSHLKYSGSITVKGVAEPIVEGDNLVLDGVIYHIERVSHSGYVSPDGIKEFNTTFDLSNGLSIDSDNSEDPIYPNMLPTDFQDVQFKESNFAGITSEVE